MRSNSINLWAGLLGPLFLVSVMTACTTVPITGRKQLNLVPQETLLSLSSSQYEEFMKENRQVTGTPAARQVHQVGARLQKASNLYFRQRGARDDLAAYDWDFVLIQDDSANAWALPGGKVAVHTGVLPIAGNEAGLATVMAHEMAHVVARHGGERMSQALLVQLGGMALSTAISERPETTQKLWLASFGLGATYGLVLPYSRLHETEADRIGLMLMSMAGYDPHEALYFWERMLEKQQGRTVPEFLSTHPTDRTRLNNIRQAIPAAMQVRGRAVEPDNEPLR